MSIRRYSAYILSAVITFAIGVGCSLGVNYWLFSPHWTDCGIPKFRTSLDDAGTQIQQSIAGSGISDDGFPMSYFYSIYADGTYVDQLSIYYPSSKQANSELQKRISKASEIVRQEPVLDENGGQIGERFVASFVPYQGSRASRAELLWTEHGRLVIQERGSLQDILAALDNRR